MCSLKHNKEVGTNPAVTATLPHHYSPSQIGVNELNTVSAKEMVKSTVMARVKYLYH